MRRSKWKDPYTITPPTGQDDLPVACKTTLAFKYTSTLSRSNARGAKPACPPCQPSQKLEIQPKDIDLAARSRNKKPSSWLKTVRNIMENLRGCDIIRPCNTSRSPWDCGKQGAMLTNPTPAMGRMNCGRYLTLFPPLSKNRNLLIPSSPKWPNNHKKARIL